MRFIKPFLLFLILLITPLTSKGAYTFVNAQGNNSTSASTLATAAWSSTTGDIVACSIATFTQTITTVSDVNTTAFTVQAVVTTGSIHLYLAYLLSITGNASYTVTANTTGGPNEISIACAEFTPPASTTVSLDQTNTATGNSTAPSVSVTLVTAGALIIGAVTPGGSGAPTAGAGYTIPTNGAQPAAGDTSTHQPAFLEYNLNGTGGTTTVNMTVGTGTWAIRGTSFKAVASGTTCNNRKALLGAGC